MPQTEFFKSNPQDEPSGAYKAYRILHIGFIILPIIAGIDKFCNYLADWSAYLSPLITKYIEAHLFMNIVGIIEIAAGILVAFKPRYGAFVVTVWLWTIILNLLSFPAYYDIVLRDFGLSLGALALGFLSFDYQTLRRS